MIHYHGTPLGGTRQDVARFVNNRHFCVPFTNPDDLPVIAEHGASWFADNGAFSVWKQGGELDRPAYYEWLREWSMHPGFDFAIIPDVIEGTEHENDLLLQEWDKRMYHPRYVPGVPVWHLHESLERLHRLCTGRWRRVALGSSGKWSTPGEESWWLRMEEAMHVATDKEGRPLCKLHGLRMLSPMIFTQLPLASADSTNVAQNCNILPRFGMYKPPTRAQRCEVIASRIENQQSACRWIPRSDRQKLLFQ